MTRNRIAVAGLRLALALLAPPSWAGVDYDLSSANPAYTVSYNGTGSGTLLQNCGYGGQQINDQPPPDLNGDGIPDVVMTDRNADTQGRTNNGAVFVVYGRLEGSEGRDRVLSSSFSVRIDGASTSDVLDFCWMDDLNADGQDDLVIRAFTPGNLYVLYGPLPAGPGAVIDLQTASNYNLKFVAPTNWGVGGVWFFDLNGDGALDLLMEYPNADTNGTDAGAVYVRYGPLPAGSGSDLPLNTATSYDFRIDGGAASAFLQRPWVADLNADGAPDLLVSVPNGDSFGRTDNGIVYVSTGPFPAGPGTVWRTSNTGRWQVAIHGVNSSDFLYLPITGDFTGDGAEDLCVGSEWADTGGTDRGGYWCIYGPFAYAMDSHLDLTIPGVWNVRFEPDTNSDRLALDDPIAGDTNGDGVDDLILISRLVDAGAVDSGAVYVFHGGSGGVFPAGTGNVRDLGLTSSYNLRIRSTDARDRLFYARPRDVDRDGVNDLVVLSEGEDTYSCAASDDGYVAVYFGPTPSATGNDRNIRTDYDLRFHHSNCSLTADGLHGAISDWDGDGYLDLAFAREGHSSFGFTNNGRLWFVPLSTATARLKTPGLFTNDDTPTLTWTAVSGASAYHIQVDEDPLFGSLAAENTNQTGTSWTLSSSLTNGETYYVRVKAIDGNLPDRWGPLHTFTVDTTAPTAPTLLSPGDASGTHPQVGTPTPTFDWSEASTE